MLHFATTGTMPTATLHSSQCQSDSCSKPATESMQVKTDHTIHATNKQIFERSSQQNVNDVQTAMTNKKYERCKAPLWKQI